MSAVKKYNKKLILAGAVLVSFFVLTPHASADGIGEARTFFVNPKYDDFSRTIIGATLRYVSNRAYFYVDDSYWNEMDLLSRNLLTVNMQELARQFDDVIYPKETQFWGSEPNPGIDGDARITILLENLNPGNGGYFETANLFPRKVVESSNEREMIAVSAESLGGLAKSFLAHEFQHLISFNQKELLRNTSEDIWLNELRSEYSVTLVGYNDVFDASSLERRLDTFLSDTSDSLTEWPNVPLDYAHVIMFGEYLAEQFGPQILSETLRTDRSGIDSLNNYFLSKGLSDRFSSVFGSWLAADFLNNASLNEDLGYQKQGLNDFRISPKQYALSYPEKYQLNHSAKPWEGSWHQLNLLNVPEGKSLKVDFNGESGFKLWYLDNMGNFGSLTDGGYIPIKNGLSYITLMPVNESKTSNFDENEDPGVFSANIEFIDTPKKPKDGELIKRQRESEIYVVEGIYKRYLRPEVIALYGHLDPLKTIEVDDEIFNSYTTANYVRNVHDEKVYAVWPDGTKHWLNITEKQFFSSGRDANSIFTINDLELNHYQTGPDIIR